MEVGVNGKPRESEQKRVNVDKRRKTMGYEYYMNPPNAVKFSQIKTDVEKGLIPSLTPFQEIDIKPGQFFIDDSAGNVLYMEKLPDGVGFARTYYSNYEWKILQKLMRHYGFNVIVPAMNNNLNNVAYEADDFEGLDDYIGSGRLNAVPEDYARVYREGVGIILPHDAPEDFARVFKEGVDTMPTPQILNVPEDYSRVYKEGVIPAPMPRMNDGAWGRKYRYIKYRETNGKVSRIQ